MKNLFATAGFVGLAMAAAPAARAQSTIVDAPAAGTTAPVPARAADARRANMTAEEIKREQQLQVLEARTGLGTSNTSFGRGAAPVRQFDTNAGGFTVRKFKAAPGAGKQKRGETRPAGGANPSGKPLVHKHPRKKRFLFF